MKTSELATQLSGRGWTVITKDVLAWETKSTAGLCPARIRAVADVFDIEQDSVILHREGAAETLIKKVARTSWFADLAWKLAGKAQTTFDTARASLLGQMSATANRGDDLTEEQWREMLERLVSNRLRLASCQIVREWVARASLNMSGNRWWEWGSALLLSSRACGLLGLCWC